MISTVVYARYARSLVDVVTEEGIEAEVSRDLQVYLDIFSAVPDLLSAFDNPAVPRDAKERVLSELVARYPVNGHTENFLRVLLANNRIRHFSEIVEYYGKALNDKKGILAARVTAASKLSEKEASLLAERLSSALGSKITMSLATDPELLGGLVVQIGSTVYDGSIRKQLSEVKQRLMDSGIRR